MWAIARRRLAASLPMEATQNCCRVRHLPTGTAQQALGRERTANLRNAMEAIRRRLDDADTAGALAGQNRARRDQVGSGRRRDKRRTHRFQDDCVYDSITGRIARCRDVLRGDFDELWAR
jgi:peptide chain release factor 1